MSQSVDQFDDYKWSAFQSAKLISKPQNHLTQSKTNADANTLCDGKDITNCIALKRIISMLQFYHHNHHKYNQILHFLEGYKSHLLSDYHHILDRHLNEDKTTKTESNHQFEMMHQQIKTTMNKHSCDITKCNIYSRTNRQREVENIDCNDDNLSMFIDIMDTIHCFIVHSVDVGHRIIKSQINDDDKEDEIVNDSKAYDPNMARMRRHLRSKRQKLETMRGEGRFMTHLESNKKFMTHLPS